jgi:hypothetical protein
VAPTRVLLLGSAGKLIRRRCGQVDGETEGKAILIVHRRCEPVRTFGVADTARRILAAFPTAARAPPTGNSSVVDEPAFA